MHCRILIIVMNSNEHTSFVVTHFNLGAHVFHNVTILLYTTKLYSVKLLFIYV